LHQKPSAVQVNIQQLELRGFERSSARSIAESLRHHFSLLLATRGIPPEWMRTQLLDDARTQDVIRIDSGTSVRAIGERIARAVFDLRIGDRR
jgi:hypothetical protein